MHVMCYKWSGEAPSVPATSAVPADVSAVTAAAASSSSSSQPPPPSTAGSLLFLTLLIVELLAVNWSYIWDRLRLARSG